MKLSSMTDFVLEQGGASVESDLFYFLCSNYAQFLKQPLTLGMFVPCVDNEVFNYSKHGGKEQYKQAKERVLFEGFNQDYIVIPTFLVNFKKTVEDLISISYLEITLTPSAIKQIGL